MRGQQSTRGPSLNEQQLAHGRQGAELGIVGFVKRVVVLVLGAVGAWSGAGGAPVEQTVYLLRHERKRRQLLLRSRIHVDQRTGVDDLQAEGRAAQVKDGASPVSELRPVIRRGDQVRVCRLEYRKRARGGRLPGHLRPAIAQIVLYRVERGTLVRRKSREKRDQPGEDDQRLHHDAAALPAPRVRRTRRHWPAPVVVVVAVATIGFCVVTSLVGTAISRVCTVLEGSLFIV